MLWLISVAMIAIGGGLLVKSLGDEGFEEPTFSPLNDFKSWLGVVLMVCGSLLLVLLIGASAWPLLGLGRN